MVAILIVIGIQYLTTRNIDQKFLWYILNSILHNNGLFLEFSTFHYNLSVCFVANIVLLLLKTVFFLAFYSSLGMRGIYYLEGFLYSMLKTLNHLMQENDGRSGFYCFILTYDGYFSSVLPYI